MTGTTDVLDLVFLRKSEDGSVDVDELSDVPDDAVGDLLAHEAALAMLLAEEDIVAVAEALEPQSIAAVLVYENHWAGPFAASVVSPGPPVVGGTGFGARRSLPALMVSPAFPRFCSPPKEVLR